MGAEGSRYLYSALILLLTSTGLLGICWARGTFKRAVFFLVFQSGPFLFFLWMTFQGSPDYSLPGGTSDPTAVPTLNPFPLEAALVLVAVSVAVSMSLLALSFRLQGPGGGWEGRMEDTGKPKP